MEAVVANASRNAWLMGLKGEIGVIAPGGLGPPDSSGAGR
jgi:hypothetical protein